MLSVGAHSTQSGTAPTVVADVRNLVTLDRLFFIDSLENRLHSEFTHSLYSLYSQPCLSLGEFAVVFWTNMAS